MDHEFARSCFDRYSAGIYRYALSILKRPGLSEDVLQETFLRLITHPAPGLTVETAQAWLYRVARNLCFDILRQPGTEYTQSAPIVPDEYAYLDLIAPLSQTEQEIVTLKIVGNLTHREIARILRTTPSAAQKRYERAIQKLRETEESK